MKPSLYQVPMPEISTLPLSGKVWPLWSVDLPKAVKTKTGLVPKSEIYMKTAPLVNGFRPATFQKEADRNGFLAAYPKAPKEYFPLFADMLTGKHLPPDNLYYMASEVNLLVTAYAPYSVERYLTLQRDGGAPSFQHCFYCPGGQMDCFPGAGGLRRFNEEVAIILKGDKNYSLLNLTADPFGYRDVTIMSREEKEAQIPLALERMRATYGDVFGDVRAEDVHVIPYDLDENYHFSRFESKVSVTDEGYVEQGYYMVTHYPEKRAIGLQRNAALDIAGFGYREHVDPLDINSMDKQGCAKLFVADVESPHFERPAYLLTIPQLAYAAAHNRVIDEVAHSLVEPYYPHGPEYSQEQAFVEKWTPQGLIRQAFDKEGRLRTIGPMPS
ncbi:MAG: hypothetical protein AB7S81_08300 [Bdellovibrionales bacterium]